MHPVIAISLGACIGALARWRLGLALNHDGAWLPWGTLAANLIGGYVVGLVIGLLEQHPQLHPAWRLFWVTGLLGGLTTFSSFSAELVQMLMLARWPQALATLAAHLGGSLLLTFLGLRSALLFVASRA
jgi:CrcB protein